MNRIMAELKVLRHRKLFIYTFIISVGVLGLLYVQKCFNLTSGMYQKEIVTPFYMLAFNSVVSSALGFLLFNACGCIIGGSDEDNNLYSLALTKQGRIMRFLVKLLSSFVVSVILVLFIFILSFIEGIIVSFDLSDFDILLALKYFFVMILISFYYSMVGLFLTNIFKKSTYGFLACIGLQILYSSFPKYLNEKFITRIVANTFGIISERNDIQMSINLSEGIGNSYFVIGGLIIICSLIIMTINWKREYKC